jgi:hypothetical protein
MITRPDFSGWVTPERPFDEEMVGIIIHKRTSINKRRTRLEIDLQHPKPGNLKLELPVSESPLRSLKEGARVRIRLLYPETADPVIPGTLGLVIEREDGKGSFILLHGRKDLPEPLENRLRIGWGRAKNTRIETSTRAFCERTVDRYSFDLAGASVGQVRTLLPGDRLVLTSEHDAKIALYAGDCTRIIGGTCPNDTRGLWNCQIAISLER